MRLVRSALVLGILAGCGPGLGSAAGGTSGGATTGTGEAGPPPDVALPDLPLDACGPIDGVPPTECYPPGAHSGGGRDWILEAPDGGDCALVCIVDLCMGDYCQDGVNEIRIVHDGVRAVIEVMAESWVGAGVDPDRVDVLEAEGTRDGVQYRVAHPAYDTSTYEMWATDAGSGTPLWGPAALVPRSP